MSVNAVCLFCGDSFVGLRKGVKICQKESCRRRYHAQFQMSFRRRNLEANREYQKQWRVNNPDKFKASQEKYSKALCLGGCGNLAMKQGLNRGGKIYSGYCHECFYKQFPIKERICIKCNNVWQSERGNNLRNCPDCRYPISLEEIGSKLGVSKQRAQQLVKNWLRHGTTRREAAERLLNGERAPDPRTLKHYLETYPYHSYLVAVQ